MNFELLQSLVDSLYGFSPTYRTFTFRRNPNVWSLNIESLLLENLQEAYSETFIDSPELAFSPGSETRAEAYFPIGGRVPGERFFAVGRKRVISSLGRRVNLLFDNSTYDGGIDFEPRGPVYHAWNQDTSSILEDRTVAIDSAYVRRVGLQEIVTYRERDFQILTVNFVPQVNYTATVAILVDELADGIAQLVSGRGFRA